MAVPNTFAAATSAIPLANLDANFAYYDAAYSITGTAISFTGAVTLSTGTANGVPYLNASKVLTSGSVLTFDGTILSSTRFAGALNGTVGATTANTGAFTTLTTSSTVTLTGGTANGVTYLNGSKVLTSGTALTFDGTLLTTTGKAHIGSTTGSNFQLFSYQNASTGSSAAFVVRQDGTDPIAIFQGAGGAERMRLDSSGNLGIGTNSPSASYNLTLAGATAANGILIYNTSDSSRGGRIRASGTGAVGVFDISTTSSGYALTFGIDVAEKMRLDTSGNLGIGTTSPTSKLTVAALRTTSSGEFLGGINALDTTTGGAAGVGGVITLSGDTQGAGYKQFAAILGGKENSTLTDLAGYAAFYTRPGGGNLTERMRLTSAGNLGIGTTTPDNKLSVYGDTTGSVGIKVTNNNATGVDKYISMFAGGTNTGVAAWNNSGVVESAVGTNLVFSGYNGTILFQTGTSRTERMRLDSSGNLGLGVTPSVWYSGASAFQVKNATIQSNGSNNSIFIHNAYYDTAWRYIITGQQASYIAQTNGQHIWYNAPSGTAGNAITFTQAMTLEASGRWLLGTTTGVGGDFASIRFNSGSSFPQGLNMVDANASANGTAFQVFRRSDDTYLGNIRRNGTDNALYVGGNSYLALGSGDTERARIDSSGNLLVGTTSAGLNRVVSNGGFQSIDSTQFNISSTSSSTPFEYVLRVGTAMQFYVSNASVVATLSASGVWTNASDARYKENIRPVAYGLAEVMQLQPRTYNLIGSEKQEIGFVAQEVELHIPELVDSTRNSITGEDRMTLSYGQMSAVLVKAIQEQQALIESLTQRLAAAGI